MTIPLHIIHLLMEDITAALCLDNRLRGGGVTALPHLGRKKNRRSKLDFGFYPPPFIPRLVFIFFFFFFPPSPLSPAPPPSLPAFSSPPLLPLISPWYSLSANGSCLQGGHQIHYQVGQQFPHCFRTVKTTRRKGEAERRGEGKMERRGIGGKVRRAI